jgi:hypothetical protein
MEPVLFSHSFFCHALHYLSLCKQKKTNTEKHLKTMLSLFRFFIQFPKQKHNHQPGISFEEKKKHILFQISSSSTRQNLQKKTCI